MGEIELEFCDYDAFDLDYELKAKAGMTLEAQIERMMQCIETSYEEKKPWEY